MAADERLGDLVELLRRHAGTHCGAQVRVREGENPPSRRHGVDLARALELDQRTATPTAASARWATSSNDPWASIACTLPPCVRYHATTGSVCAL